MKRKHIKTSVAALPNVGMAAVAGMIADPSDFPVIRKSGTYSTMPTATAKPYVRESVTWDPTAAADARDGLPPTDWGGFIFRNPLRAAVIYERYPNSTIKYNWLFNPVPTELGEQGAGSMQTYISTQEQTELRPVWAVPDALNTYNPHGSRLYAAEDDGTRYIWCDGDGTLSAIQFQIAWSTASTIANSRVVYVYKWDGGLKRLVTTFDSGPIGTVTYSTTLPAGGAQSGYYSIQVNNQDVAGLVTFSTASTNVTKVWAHKTAGQWDNNITNISGMRVLAANVLVQNKASPLNKQGKAVICQALRSEDWYSFYGKDQTMYNTISSSPNSRSFNWEDGLYGYLKPTGEQDMDWLDPFITTGSTAGVIEDICYKLVQSDYLAFCVSTTVAGAGDAQYTFQHALEYRTRNQWIETLPPSVSPEEWEAGVQAVISMEQFYHNPIHWAKIFSTIGKLARVGAPVISKFGPYGAMAGSIMGAIGEALK